MQQQLEACTRDSSCFRWVTKYWYDSIETSDAWLAFNIGMIKHSDLRHPSEEHPSVLHKQNEEGGIVVSIGGTLMMDAAKRKQEEELISNAPWQNSVRDNSTVYSDSRIRIDAEASHEHRKFRRKKIDFTTGGKVVEIVAQQRLRLTKDALIKQGESRDVHGYVNDSNELIEPDFDQYDYDDDDENNIAAWGAPYSRHSEAEETMSGMHLLSHTDDGAKNV